MVCVGNIAYDDNDIYLQSIKFVNEKYIDITTSIKSNLMTTLTAQFNNDKWSILEKRIMIEINKLKEINPTECNVQEEFRKWIKCRDTCESLVKSLMNTEIKTTAYILRALCKSIIIINDGYNPLLTILILDTDKSNINGLWQNDSKYLKIVQYGTEKFCNPCQSGKLIMGFGPSASGKTFWAKTIIKIFKEADKTYPDSFITIDGGIYRETSNIYQITKQLIKKKCLAGFTNLVQAGLTILNKSLFKAGSIKKLLVNFIKDQKSIKINLYVPDTLAGCGIPVVRECKKVYEPYINITGDTKWIGLLIWQHKLGTECEFPSKYKCVGTTESGKRRERDEGKKYSNSTWSRAMSNGMTALLKAPGGSYKIHNTGGKKYVENGKEHNCINIIEDYTNTLETQHLAAGIERMKTKYNYDYVHKEI